MESKWKNDNKFNFIFYDFPFIYLHIRELKNKLKAIFFIDGNNSMDILKYLITPDLLENSIIIIFMSSPKIPNTLIMSLLSEKTIVSKKIFGIRPVSNYIYYDITIFIENLDLLLIDQQNIYFNIISYDNYIYKLYDLLLNKFHRKNTLMLDISEIFSSDGTNNKENFINCVRKKLFLPQIRDVCYYQIYFDNDENLIYNKNDINEVVPPLPLYVRSEIIDLLQQAFLYFLRMNLNFIGITSLNNSIMMSPDQQKITGGWIKLLQTEYISSYLNIELIGSSENQEKMIIHVLFPRFSYFL